MNKWDKVINYILLVLLAIFLIFYCKERNNFINVPGVVVNKLEIDSNYLCLVRADAGYSYNVHITKQEYNNIVIGQRISFELNNLQYNPKATSNVPLFIGIIIGLYLLFLFIKWLVYRFQV